MYDDIKCHEYMVAHIWNIVVLFQDESVGSDVWEEDVKVFGVYDEKGICFTKYVLL